MYQRIRNLLFHTLVPAVLAVFLFSFPALAEEVFCTVNIPAEVRVSGSRIPSGVEYELVLERVTENAPMPETSALIVKDSGKASFGPIIYTAPGDYQYRVFQRVQPSNNFTFDESSYLVTVRVVNAQDGTLTAVCTVEKSSGENKSDGIIFDNKYTRPSSGSDDDDDDDDDRPSRVITGDNKPGPGNPPISFDPENRDVITDRTDPEPPAPDPALPDIPKLGDMGAAGYLGGMIAALMCLFLSVTLYLKLGKGEEG